MTFTQLQTDIAERLGLESDEALERIGRAINRHNRRISASVNLTALRRAPVSEVTTADVADVTFNGVEKLLNLWHYAGGSRLDMTEVTPAHLRTFGDPVAGVPTHYAITYASANSVTVTLNALPDDAYDLFADAIVTLADLSGAGYPVLAESYHDAIAEAVIADELYKQEKPKLAERAERRSEGLIAELRHFMAKSSTLVQRQGDLASGRPLGGAGGGSAQSASTMTFLQAGTGAVQRTVTSKLREIVSPSDFGGEDFGAQLAAAIASLPAEGGVVDARGMRGTYASADNPFDGVTKPLLVLLGAMTIETDDTWIIPQKVIVQGVGRGEAADYGDNNTTIRASATFSSTFENTTPVARAAVLVLGDTNPASHGCRVENLGVDCNALADYGIYSESINELSGAVNCVVYDPLVAGVFIEATVAGAGDGSPQNYSLTDLEILFANAAIAGSAVGLKIDGGGGSHRGIERVSVNGSGADSGNGIATGVQIIDAPGFYGRIHVEYCTDGVLVDSGCVVLAGVDGTPNVTNVVRITDEQQDVVLMGILKGAATNVLQDDVLSVTLTDTSLGFYALGEGTPGSNAVISSARLSRQQLRTRWLELCGETAQITTLLLNDGETLNWSLQRSANNTDFQIRDVVDSLTRFVLDRSTGYAAIGAADGGAAVRINSITNHGTGGLEVWSGGASPARVIRATSAGAVLPEADGTQALGSATLRWRVFHEVVATASLPAAGASNDGRIIIEDAGAGDRNVIIYAGGERFRIDGGSTF